MESDTPTVYKYRPSMTAPSFVNEVAALEAEASGANPAAQPYYIEKYARLSADFLDKLEADGFDAVLRTRAAEGVAADAEAEVAELERQVRALEEEMEGDEEAEQRAAAERLADGRAAAAVEAFERFADARAEWAAHQTLSRAVLGALNAKSVDDLREGRVAASDVRFFTSWEDKQTHLDGAAEDARAAAAEVAEADPECLFPADLAAEEAEQAALADLAAETQARMQDGQDQRDEQERRLRAFRRECDKLLLWCRRQLANLEAMQDPDHVQEFCAILVDNYASMSNNFTVLLESVSDYVRAGNAEVRAALMEAHELWFLLQATAYERLSRILFEIHPTSPLPVEVGKYAEYTRRVSSFASDLFDALQAATPAAPPQADAIAHQCEEQMDVAARHDELAEELAAFADRQTALRDAYACLRTALLARLTFLQSPEEVLAESKRRQEEFEECANGLKTWATEASRGPAWRDIYAKIVEIKRLIQAEQATLDGQAPASGDEEEEEQVVVAEEE